MEQSSLNEMLDKLLNENKISEFEFNKLKKHSLNYPYAVGLFLSTRNNVQQKIIMTIKNN